MNKTLAMIFIILGFGGSAAMWIIGTNDSALTELADTFWVPIPLGIVGLFGLIRKKKPA